MDFIGVDGCKENCWFAVILMDDNKWEVALYKDIKCLWNKNENASTILIDIPIGLLENDSKERERKCDKEARKKLGKKRASSVFPVPCRKAIYAKNDKDAIDFNRKMMGRGLSKQTLNIIDRIREVDEFFLFNNHKRICIREVHPEICFWALNNANPMNYSKKKKEGFKERCELLNSVFPHAKDIIEYAISKYRRNQVSKDDILDALSAAVTAKLGITGTIPEIPEFDLHDLPMEMVYHALSQ